MVSSVPKELTEIEEEFDRFMVLYSSLDLGDKNPQTNGTKSAATIVCYQGNQLVGVLSFHERQPPPVNSYRGSRVPHINLNFHISRFNEIMNLIRYQRPLTIWFDVSRSDGGLSSGEIEDIGQQEGV
jgi:hypothetical protein